MKNDTKKSAYKNKDHNKNKMANVEEEKDILDADYASSSGSSIDGGNEDEENAIY
jgi:hypothetical protein